jgi:hypothetical protein
MKLHRLLPSGRLSGLLSVASALVLLGQTSVRAQYVPAPVYVDGSLPNNGSGDSWSTAFNSLDSAIAGQLPGGALWVKVGTYKPSSQSSGFLITKQLKLYGGFAGDEQHLGDRHGSFTHTVLDGDIGTQSYRYDNVWHVVNISGVTGTSGQPGVILDGFLVRNEYAFGDTSHPVGGGIRSICSDLQLANMYVGMVQTPNYAHDGAGLYFSGGCSYDGGGTLVANLLQVKWSHFTGNYASDNNVGGPGGGIFASEVVGEAVNTDFVDNLAGGGAGGMQVAASAGSNHFNFTNCIFLNNTANQSSGGGLLLDGSLSTIVNCTFKDNIASTGGTTTNGQAISDSSGSYAWIYNSIIYFNNYIQGLPILAVFGSGGNITVEYSDVENTNGVPLGGQGNRSDNPQFNAGNVTLSLTSHCIDAADYGRLPQDHLDINGNGNTTEFMPIDYIDVRRIYDQTTVQDTGQGTYTFLDMGAYERH